MEVFHSDDVFERGYVFPVFSRSYSLTLSFHRPTRVDMQIEWNDSMFPNGGFLKLWYPKMDGL